MPGCWLQCRVHASGCELARYIAVCCSLYTRSREACVFCNEDAWKGSLCVLQQRRGSFSSTAGQGIDFDSCVLFRAPQFAFVLGYIGRQ